jgi:DNA-binding XRE family transcriptional regulator
MDRNVFTPGVLPNIASVVVPTQPFRGNGDSGKTGIAQQGRPFFSRMPPRDSYPQLPRGINSRFGNRLRELRRAQNLTQLQMAVYFGIDRSFISDVECGKKSISLCFLEVIALGMNITVAEMLRGL